MFASGGADPALPGGGSLMSEPQDAASESMCQRADVGQLDDVAEGIVDHGRPDGRAEILSRPRLTPEADAGCLQCVHGLVEGVGRNVEREVTGARRVGTTILESDDVELKVADAQPHPGDAEVGAGQLLEPKQVAVE